MDWKLELMEVKLKSPVTLLRDLFIDLKRLHPDVRDLDRDFHTIEKRTKGEGFSFLAKTLPELFDSVLHGVETGQFTCPRHFKKQRGGAIPHFFKGMLCKIFDSETGVLLENADEGVLKSIYLVCAFFKKAIVDDESSDKLDAKAYNDFFSTDAEIVRLNDSQMIDAITRVSYHILPNLTVGLDQIVGMHGPGAVFEGVKGNQKWKFLYDELRKGSPVVDFGFDMFVAPFYDSLSLHRNNLKSSTSLFAPSPRSVAKLSCVPKNSTSKRTITVEPLMHVFMQKGLMVHLRDCIKRCPILSPCLDINDQSKNQNLAKIGSLTGEWSTIDLKSASDLLSVNLVEAVFGRDQEFLDLMLDFRSQYVQCQNNVVRIKKFAGMGNALTFPVQSVVYAVVMIAAILIARNTRITGKSVKAASRCIQVYGDDLIVKTEYMTQVCSALHRVGLKVNTKKSFSNGRFRESCGADYFKGVNITPIRLKYHPRLISTDSRAVTNLIHASNESYRQCYYKLSDSLRKLVEGYLGPLPLVREESQALGWHTRVNATTLTKWCRHTHQFLFRGTVVRERKVKDLLSGYPALLKFFLSPRLNEEVGRTSWFDPPVGRLGQHLLESSVRYHTKVSKRWVPAM